MNKLKSIAHNNEPVAGPLERIEINLKTQSFAYYLDDQGVASFFISSGVRQLPTPVGAFRVQRKVPIINYSGWNLNGTQYYYPNTKWNLQFIPHYYIHGAYWHNNFGRVMSHGCINVSYANMSAFYDFADPAISIYIHY